MSKCAELISLLDENGIALQVSNEHELVLGYPSAQLVNKCVFDFVHPADIDSVREAFLGMIQAYEEVVIRFRFRHINGEWIRFESRGEPLTDDGCVKGFRVVSHVHRCVDLKALVQKLECSQLAEGS